MKRILCLLAVLFAGAGSLCAFGAFDFTLGSGYVWYGRNDTKDRNAALSGPRQVVLNTGAAFKYKIVDPVYLAAGMDVTLDFHWFGDEYVYLFDYAGLIGVQFYPGAGGLLVGVDYALGCRTDFYRVDGYAGRSAATKWGSGFKLSVMYDFLYNKGKRLRPVAGASLRWMPRGNGSDTMLSAFLRLTLE